MKQIFITPEIEAMAEEYADNLFTDKRASFVQPIEGLKNLQTDIIELNDHLGNQGDYVAYLEKIINEYDELKKLMPSGFGKKKEEFDELLNPKGLSVEINCRSLRLSREKEEMAGIQPCKSKFYEEVVSRMRYEEARPVLAKYMMEEIGVQTCVYCNNADATYSEEQKEAYYHLDHWKPKDEYPFLSVCFFNLYPCCANCNGHKMDGKKGSFQLFAETEPASDPFVFVVNRKSYEEMKPDTLSVEFDERKAADREYCKEYDKVYRIRKFYNAPTSLRQVEKLIYDINSHRCSYPTATDRSIPGIVDKKRLFHFVLGVDSDESNIFTDVKKKLKLDMAKDAGLI